MCLLIVLCRPSSVKTFITLSDITTENGYPKQISGGSRIHLRTVLVFRYHTNNELCSAAAGRRVRRDVPDMSGSLLDIDRPLQDTDGPSDRVRRQATFERDVMSQELIDAILAYEDKLVKLLTGWC